MIFVTVGNATQNSSRLLNAIDSLAGAGAFGIEDVVVQYGNNAAFHSERCICKAFLTIDEFSEAIEQADVVVCHAGSGTILHVLRTGKVPVVVPRLVRYGEVIDDHQAQLAEALSKSGKVLPVADISELEIAIARARSLRTEPHHVEKTPLAALVAVAIEDLVARGRRVSVGRL